MKKILFTSLLALILSPLSVFAEGAQSVDALAAAPAYKDAACKTDVAKYCAGKAGKEAKLCMKNNFPDFTDACKEKFVAEADAEGGCTADRYQFCGDMLTGTVDSLEGGLLTCYLENFDKLAPGCQNKVSKLEPCIDDIMNFCGSVDVGAGRVSKCLLDNQRKVTPRCAAAQGFKQK